MAGARPAHLLLFDPERFRREALDRPSHDQQIALPPPPPRPERRFRGRSMAEAEADARRAEAEARRQRSGLADAARRERAAALSMGHWESEDDDAPLRPTARLPLEWQYEICDDENNFVPGPRQMARLILDHALKCAGLRGDLEMLASAGSIDSTCSAVLDMTLSFCEMTYRFSTEMKVRTAHGIRVTPANIVFSAGWWDTRAGPPRDATHARDHLALDVLSYHGIKLIGYEPGDPRYGEGVDDFYGDGWNDDWDSDQAPSDSNQAPTDSSSSSSSDAESWEDEGSDADDVSIATESNWHARVAAVSPLAASCRVDASLAHAPQKKIREAVDTAYCIVHRLCERGHSTNLLSDRGADVLYHGMVALVASVARDAVASPYAVVVPFVLATRHTLPHVLQKVIFKFVDVRASVLGLALERRAIEDGLCRYVAATVARHKAFGRHGDKYGNPRGSALLSRSLRHHAAVTWRELKEMLKD